MSRKRQWWLAENSQNISSQFNILDIDGPLGQDSSRGCGASNVYEHGSGSTLLRMCSIPGPSQGLFLFVCTLLLRVGCSVLDDRGGNGN